MIEKFWWIVFVVAVAAVIYVSGDGFYRYKCQDPANWTTAECQPPICTATKTCPSDLTGGLNG